MPLEENFSQQAPIYARYRPQYPAALFARLAELAPGRELAWDCATGSGQAALGLVDQFRQVWATDASPGQIAQAVAHERIHYRVGPAGDSGLPGRAVDLISVAQALHWFDLESFYAEAQRVLKPGGVLAAWCYLLPDITPEIDPILRRYYEEVLGPFWAPGIRRVEERYANLPFPFAELEPPGVRMEAEWDLEQVSGFLRSWSATPEYVAAHGRHPLEEVQADLEKAWGPADEKRRVHWPMCFRIGVQR
jgi:SAM-dependent methyltransferase